MVSPARSGPPAEPPTLIVFYGGACPLCSREIGPHRRCDGADRIAWVDVSRSTQAEVAPGLTCEQALRRFHVRHGDGRIGAGGRAFTDLWAALPGWRRLGRLFQARPLHGPDCRRVPERTS